MHSGTQVADHQELINAIRSGPAPPLSQEEREEILKQLDGILHSAIFRNSKRYPALLRYVVVQKLNGREDSLKERILGIEVFGRSPNYDTNVDHVVRTAAGEVRKRLALYYMDQGRGDRLRIEVPAGSYVPQFKWTAERAEILPVTPSIEAAPPPTAKQEVRGWARHYRLIFTTSMAANLVLLIALVGRSEIITLFRGESTLQKFWDPVFQTSSPVLLCVGLRNGPGQPGNAGASSTGSQQPADASTVSQDPLMSRVAMADLLSLARISAYAGQRHSPYRILNPAITSFGDLRAAPTVLIGVGNNNWTQRVANGLRFTYIMNDTGIRPVAIRDRQNPTRGDWQARDGIPESYKDYAIVSRLLDPRIEQVIVLVGGLGPHGTEVAGEFVTSATHMMKLNAYAPSGWQKKNIQVVLSTEVVKGSSGPPKIEAAWFW